MTIVPLIFLIIRQKPLNMRNPPFHMSRDRFTEKIEKDFIGPGFYEERRNL